MTAKELVEDAVRRSILHLSKDAPCLLAAVSGGADSVAMLHALVRLRDASLESGAALYPRFRLCCVHVNHNLRGEESRGDAEFVATLCKQWDVPCRLETVEEGSIEKKAKDSNCGIEAAAREARHTIFQNTASLDKADKILIAHNRDDLLENILIRILRGSGPAGLAPLKKESGNILRPLLSLSRAGILSYLALNNIIYRVDSSNNDENFFRNKVRLRLIPLLESYFPSWKKNLFQFAETQGMAADYLKKTALVKIDESEKTYNAIKHKTITIENFSTIAPILQEEIIFNALNRFGDSKENIDSLFEPDTISEKQIIPRRDSLRRALQQKKDADLGGASIQFFKDSVIISLKEPLITEENYSLLIEHEGVYHYKNIKLECYNNMQDKKDKFFYITLPLVLYAADNNDFIMIDGKKHSAETYKKKYNAHNALVSARDAEGIAAFILVSDDCKIVAQRKDCNADNAQSNTVIFALIDKE
jgi:tRNA(Ile)-lysidine synthase